MRATIAIDDRLFEEARKLAPVKTKKALVELCLKEFIQRRRMEHLAGLYGSGLVDLDVRDVEAFRSDDEG
ncbi:type II toxin-antitoxin system VapB family antitoxin [Desulfonatronospira sp.]|uniref:type II toxin-antitoxin system VapB family antitoxin n=1 Tax=Desulfonatronospira sp. TaxID=1962951 RepID=UPI0025C36B6A|nr:type II toxin-antitoxin system VapB family antitoxin [Desulfonatronospira sp.]